MQLYLNFHDHMILVSSNEESLIKKLKDEFNYFIHEAAERVQTTVDIFRESPPELPSMVAKKILETCTVYRLGPRQYVDYCGQALSVHDSMEDTVRIYSLDQDRLYEISFLAIHSILGQALEKKGICRVHALSVSMAKCNAVIMLPTKGGKSTLLSYLIENPDLKIISDDMPLIDLNGRVHPFPSKISLEVKPEDGPLSRLQWTEFKKTQSPSSWTAGLSQLNQKIETQNLHQKTLLIAGLRLSQGQSILTATSKWKMISPLIEHMVIGFGLPQALEMFFKFNFTDFFKLLYHGLIRSLCAIQLLRRSTCYYFYMGPDRAYNAQLLLDQMYEQQTT